MKEFARDFYASEAWKQCRNAYYKSVGGLCEMCLKEGKYSAGEIVHHRVHLKQSNINNPDITLSWDNLMLLCREHHAEVHGAKKPRYRIDKDGRVLPLENR